MKTYPNTYSTKKMGGTQHRSKYGIKSNADSKEDNKK
jgi:hypothetical protein